MNVCLFGDARSVHVRQLVAALHGRGAVVHIVTHKPADVPGATMERCCVPPAGWTNPRGWRRRRRRYLADFFRRFDIVNVHFLADWGFDDAVLDDPRRRAGLVATAWGSDVVDPPGEIPATEDLKTARRWLLRRADAVTTCGPSFARVVADYAEMPVGGIEVSPFGVDRARFTVSDGSAARDADEPTVGFFKGFRSVYGATTLVRALPAILRQSPRCRFQLVGDGPERSECHDLARRLGVESRIAWIPRQEHDGLPAILARWTVSVIPSIHEAFGVAALESSAMKLPVVASDVCGLRDTVRDGETGLRVAPGEPEALAEAVVRLLGDAGMRRRMGDAGRRMVEREYDWSRLAVRWMMMYERVRESRCVVL